MTVYGLNVTRWETDHPGWFLDAGFENVGWKARPKGQRNGWVSAATLDDLAVAVKEVMPDSGQASARQDADPS